MVKTAIKPTTPAGSTPASMSESAPPLCPDELVKISEPYYNALKVQGVLADDEVIAGKQLAAVQSPVIAASRAALDYRLKREKYRQKWRYKNIYLTDKWAQKDTRRALKSQRKADRAAARAVKRSIKAEEKAECAEVKVLKKAAEKATKTAQKAAEKAAKATTKQVRLADNALPTTPNNAVKPQESTAASKKSSS